MKLNKRLLPIKAHYFFSNGGSAPVAPFLAVIGKDMGFSSTIVGLILTAVPLTSLIVKPIVGAVADKFRIHKTIFIFLIFTNLIFFFCMQWIPSLPSDRSVNFHCVANESDQISITTSKAGDECFTNRLSGSNNASIICSAECPMAVDAMANNTKTASAFEVKLAFNESLMDKVVFDVVSFTSSEARSSSQCIFQENTTCDLFCLDPLLQEIIRKPAVSDSQVFSQASFWLFAIFVLAARVAASCTNSLGDSICFKLLGMPFTSRGPKYPCFPRTQQYYFKNRIGRCHQTTTLKTFTGDRPNDYGYQRMWGAAGWGLIAFITGIIVDRMSEGKYIKDFTTAFYLSAGLMFLDIIVASKLEGTVSAKSPSILSNVKKVLIGNYRFLLFLVIIVFCGIFSGLIWSFLFWFIEEVASEDGCSDQSWIKTLDGLTLAVHCYLGEIPFFWISGWMLKHIGHAHCMTIVLVAFSVRFVFYYFLTNAWWILPIEALNGITFATFYSTMTTYANALTPQGMHGTIQGFVAAIFEIGIAIGSVSGGYVLGRYGGRTMYLIGGITAAVLAVIHTVIQLICGAEAPKKPDPAAQVFLNKNENAEIRKASELEM